MAAVFWLLVLGAGVVAGQPWAWLVLAVILACLALARPAKPAPPPLPPQAKARKAAAPAPAAPIPPIDTRQLKRRWREEDLRAWQEDFDRLLGA